MIEQHKMWISGEVRIIVWTAGINPFEVTQLRIRLYHLRLKQICQERDRMGWDSLDWVPTTIFTRHI